MKLRERRIACLVIVVGGRTVTGGCADRQSAIGGIIVRCTTAGC